MNKTVIVDWSNLSMAKLFNKDVISKGINSYDITNIDYSVWKFKVFEALWYYFKKYPDITEFIIAIDSSKYWRKLIFPLYKAHRSEFRGKFNIDWKEYYKVQSDYLQVLKEHFPFKIIEVTSCEADDIIGTLVLENKEDYYHVFSSDNDYLQLCSPRTKIYSPLKQSEIKHPNPKIFLEESCLTGQAKDNIFNILTPVDYPSELRKPALGKSKITKILIQGLDNYLDQEVSYKKKFIDKSGETMLYSSKINLKERFDLNMKLIDLKQTPESLKKIILRKQKNYVYPEPDNIYKFLKDSGWRWGLDNITNLENGFFNLYKSTNKGP